MEKELKELSLLFRKIDSMQKQEQFLECDKFIESILLECPGITESLLVLSCTRFAINQLPSRAKFLPYLTKLLQDDGRDPNIYLRGLR